MVGSTATAPRIALLDPELDMADYGHPNFFRTVNRCLFQSGYVVLRNAIDRNRCAIFQRLLGRTHEELHAALRSKGIHIDRLQLEDRSKSAWHEIAWDLRRGQVIPAVFSMVNPGLAADDVIADWKLYNLLQNFFAGSFHPSVGCKTQRIDPARATPIVHWRTDAQHYGANSFGVTVWAPLEDCGRDAPGIQFAPANHRTVQDFLKHDPDRPGSFDPSAVAMIEDGRYISGIYGGAVAQPELLAGDVAIFTNWTLHATRWSAEMQKPRHSIECRFSADQFEFPDCIL